MEQNTTTIRLSGCDAIFVTLIMWLPNSDRKMLSTVHSQNTDGTGSAGSTTGGITLAKPKVWYLVKTTNQI